MVKKLIESGAAINAQNKFNETALIFALEEGIHPNTVVVMWINYAIETIYIN